MSSQQGGGGSGFQRPADGFSSGFVFRFLRKKSTKYRCSYIPYRKFEDSFFLADDVLKSGKTIMYGIKAILEYPVENLKTIILVNRNHNQFPIGVDYIGLNLSTTLKDHIKVILTQKEESVYLV